MNSNLYIPKTITVGFQKREDTYTGKLAYVIYTDDKGVLRKATSWNSWRDKTIDSITFENTPLNNFTFNKGVHRYGDWGTGRHVVRVYDQRDFEFEITVDNLIGILMHSDVSKRDIVQDCVYAWAGTELVLLPINSEEYQKSLVHTSKIETKFSAKDLVVGRTYESKRDKNQYIYLGRHDVYETQSDTDRDIDLYSIGVKKRREHVFSKVSEQTEYGYANEPWEYFNPSSKLAFCVDENQHPELAERTSKFFGSVGGKKPVGFKVVPSANEISSNGHFYGTRLFKQYEDTIWSIDVHSIYVGYKRDRISEIYEEPWEMDLDGEFPIIKSNCYQTGYRYWNVGTRKKIREPRKAQEATDIYNSGAEAVIVLAELEAIGYGKLHYVFEDGTVSSNPMIKY